MATTVNADTSTGGVVLTGDGSGVLALQTGGVTRVTIDGTGLTINGGVLKPAVYTVASLPSASTSGIGAKSFVTDALSPTFGATVVAGGAVKTPVYSDGTNWKVG
jgi:hypothetical protein